MQYMEIKQKLKLNDLRQLVGTDNVEPMLKINSLERVPNIGEQVYSRMEQVARSNVAVPLDFKITSLNNASQDSDVFESMALMGEADWRVFNQTNALPGTLKVPEGIKLPDSVDIIGNSTRISNSIYTQVMNSLRVLPHTIDPEIFSEYAFKKANKVLTAVAENYQNLYQFFKIPWGNMTIYSSISDTTKDFPVYPEEMADGVKANYTQMPEIIYQYEPWQLYTSSGPRSNSYTFTFHRDMWTGDHRDGKANELVRFCMANCYPEYNGSAVNTALTSLYMNGQLLIRGVLTDVTANWEGPLGLDNYYLVCKLTLNFTEVSPYPLNYWSVMNKPLIG